MTSYVVYDATPSYARACCGLVRQREKKSVIIPDWCISGIVKCTEHSLYSSMLWFSRALCASGAALFASIHHDLCDVWSHFKVGDVMTVGFLCSWIPMMSYLSVILSFVNSGILCLYIMFRVTQRSATLQLHVSICSFQAHVAFSKHWLVVAVSCCCDLCQLSLQYQVLPRRGNCNGPRTPWVTAEESLIFCDPPHESSLLLTLYVTWFCQYLIIILLHNIPIQLWQYCDRVKCDSMKALVLCRKNMNIICDRENSFFRISFFLLLLNTYVTITSVLWIVWLW